MKSDNRHVFSPYPDTYREGGLLLLMMGLCAVVMDGAFARFVFVVFFGCLAARRFWASLTTVEVSDSDICVRQWRYESVPETRWEEFSQAFLLDVSWTSRGRHSHGRYCAYYLLLTRYPISPGTVRELGVKLAGTYPCGKWKDHVALRLSEEQVARVRRCIGQTLPIEEKQIDRDEAIRL